MITSSPREPSHRLLPYAHGQHLYERSVIKTSGTRILTENPRSRLVSTSDWAITQDGYSRLPQRELFDLPQQSPRRERVIESIESPTHGKHSKAVLEHTSADMKEAILRNDARQSFHESGKQRIVYEVDDSPHLFKRRRLENVEGRRTHALAESSSLQRPVLIPMSHHNHSASTGQELFMVRRAEDPEAFTVSNAERDSHVSSRTHWIGEPTVDALRSYDRMPVTSSSSHPLQVVLSPVQSHPYILSSQVPSQQVSHGQHRVVDEFRVLNHDQYEASAPYVSLSTNRSDPRRYVPVAPYRVQETGLSTTQCGSHGVLLSDQVSAVTRPSFQGSAESSNYRQSKAEEPYFVAMVESPQETVRSRTKNYLREETSGGNTLQINEPVALSYRTAPRDGQPQIQPFDNMDDSLRITPPSQVAGHHGVDTHTRPTQLLRARNQNPTERSAQG